MNMVAEKIVVENRSSYRMTLESLDRLVRSQFANVNALVGGTGGKGLVVLPVNIKGRC